LAGVREQALIAGLAAVCLVGCSGDRLPPLTADVIQANRRLWLSNSIASYDLNLVVEGTGLEEPEEIHVEVRMGKVVRALRGNLPMTGDVDAYTVPGLFTTLATELANQPESMGAPPGYKVYYNASFHRERGYPLHYRRIVGGANRKVEIRVTGFEARAPMGGQSP
jgi:hypothetical protein